MATLRLLTWNLWFGEFARARRLDAALEIVRDHSPDVIAFQEIVPETLQQVWATPWVEDGYHLTDTTGATFRLRYGTVLLTRIAPAAIHVVPLPSDMGRDLVAVDLVIGGATLRVGGIHLESEYSTPRRIEQLRRIGPFLNAADAAVLMGDMNFTDGDPEEAVLPAGAQDVWKQVRPGDPGVTRDSMGNGMARLHDRTPQSRRLDRIFLMPGASGWRASSIEIVGTEPIDGDPTLLPSDHYGLVADLVIA